MKLPDIDKARAAEWILAALLLVVCWFGGDYHGRVKAFAEAESKCDTVTKVVSVYKDFPQPVKTAQLGHIAVPSVYFLTDTITRTEWVEIAVHDSIPQYVYLPKEQKFYSEDEGRLRIWVSGYQPNLDRFEFDKAETTITQTVVHRQRWSFSVSGGLGATYDVFKKGIAVGPSIVVGGSYSF